MNGTKEMEGRDRDKETMREMGWVFACYVSVHRE